MTKPTVVPLRVEVSADCVEKCEALLAAAKSGEMTEIIFMWKSRDKFVTTGFTPTDDAFVRIGGLQRLLHRLNTNLDQT